MYWGSKITVKISVPRCSDSHFCKYIVVLLYVENFLYEQFMYDILKWLQFVRCL